MSNIKTINGLMKYLRDNHNIKINGSTDKMKLKCVGYYHGYKGYRYIKIPNNRIHMAIANAFGADNNIVSHYLKNDENVHIWGIFEIITLGEFGNLVSTFDFKIRQDIAKDIGFNIVYDSKGILVEKSIFIMKDLRNAIAHNNVVFDTRFNTNAINKTFKNMIMNDTKISEIYFNCITDYIIFVAYMLKKLKRTKNEIKKFINDYNKIVYELKCRIPKNVFDQIILTNDYQKLNQLINFIKK